MERDLGVGEIVPRAGQIDRGGQDTASAEAKVHALQLDETAQQQTGTRQQDQGDGDLGDDQAAQHVVEPATSSVTAAVPEALVRMFRRDEGRHDAKEESGDDCHDHREEDDGKIEPELIDPRNGKPVANQRQQTAMTQRSDHEARGPASHRQHEALGQHLPDEACPPRAECRAHAELALAGGASRQQQARDVDAGDEQHERHRPDERQRGGPKVAHHLLLNRHEQDVPARVPLRRILPQLREDGPHLGFGLVERHAVP